MEEKMEGKCCSLFKAPTDISLEKMRKASKILFRIAGLRVVIDLVTSRVVSRFANHSAATFDIKLFA
jgi:hypothetical protein